MALSAQILRLPPGRNRCRQSPGIREAAPVLTGAEILEFETLGHLRVPEVLDAHGIEEMERRLWRQLEGKGAERDDRSTWSADKTFGLQGIRDGDPDPAASPRLVAALDDLMGVGTWKTAPHWGQALVTFPTDETWNVPGGSWHLDHPYWLPPDEIWGLNVFLLVADLEPRGGGTGVVEGSPELIRRWLVGKDPKKSTMKQLRRGFEATHPYFQRLADRHDSTGRVGDFTSPTTIDGVEIRVAEVTGRAGDVVLCHPWALHNVMPNTADRPRLMRACRVYQRGLSPQDGD